MTMLNAKPIAIVTAVGSRIRGWRRRRKLTLDALASITGISKSYLSKLESGKKSPSIATVMKISSALDVSVGALFGEKNEEADIQVMRAADNTRLAHGVEIGATYISLSQEMNNPNIEVFLYYPSDSYDEENRADHSGDEMIYVVSGSAELIFSDQYISISAGDFVKLKGYVSHQIRKTSNNTKLILIINRY